MAIGIDFETYYDREISIKVLGVDGYVTHPDVEAYLVTIVGEGVHYSGPVEEAPWEDCNGLTWVSHNARFDQTVFNECKVRGQISEGIFCRAWKCSADLSVYLGGPRALKAACDVMLKDWKEVSKEYRVVALGKHGRDFSEEEWKIVVEAGFGDSEACLELWDKLNHLWPELEQFISESNRAMTMRGITIDVDSLDRALSTLETRLWKYGNLIPWDWSDNKTPTSGKKIREHCRTVKIPSPSSFAEDSEECAEWEEQYSADYPWIDAIRQWRKVHSLIGKLNRVKSRLRLDPETGEQNNFPYTIKYFGAHTGRFSGDGGFNMQNIYSKEREGINVRHMFIARPGKKLLIADYCQIEARILLWYANDHDALDLIRSGVSVYGAHAAQTMGYDTSRGPMKVADPDGYKLAKARVLGLGYGCGAKTFRDVARKMAGLIITPEESQQIVWDYRSSNRPITGFWSRLDTELRKALQSESRTLKLGLPSGRSMNYYNVAALKNGISVQPGLDGNRTFTWGGKLTENICQATGREIQVDGWIRALKAFDSEELSMLFHVHDEFVFEVDENIDDKKLAAILETPPEWGKTIPVEVEYDFSDHYKK